MSLPLTTRKNIRDTEPQLKEALEKIAKATGKEYSFEADWPKMIEVDASYKDQLGTLIHKEAMAWVAGNIEDLCKTETTKEAFNEATSNNKIVVRNNPNLKQRGTFTHRWGVEFENGDLIVEYKALINVQDLRNFNIVNVIPSPGLPLNSRLNIEKFREKMDAQLDLLKKATGEEWSFEADYETNIKEMSQHDQDVIGEWYWEALEPLAMNIANTIGTSETIKEAFMEATPERKIIFKRNDKINSHWQISFIDGCVVWEHKVRFADLINLKHRDLKPLIPSPGGLSLVTRENINKYKAKVDDYLAQVAKVTGVEGWSFEPEYEKAATSLDQNNVDHLGEVYAELLEGIKDLIANNMGKEVVKEAFLEAASERRIGIRFNEKAPDCWTLVFDSGAFILEHRKNVSDVRNIKNQRLVEKIPVPGDLTMVSRLNLNDYRTKLEEALEIIKKASGQDYSFDDTCLEEVIKGAPSQKNVIGEFVYKEVMLEGVAVGLANAFKDEMFQEAFSETISSRQITVRIDPKQPERYWDAKVENGVLVIVGRGSGELVNVKNINFEKLL